MTVGKRVQFDEETWAVVNLLRQERRRSFQQFADKAFADWLTINGIIVSQRVLSTSCNLQCPAQPASAHTN